MKTLLFLLLALSPARAQPVITVTAPATITAGNSATLTVSISGTSGSGLTSAGLTVILPSTFTITGSPTSNQASGGIFVQCSTATAICFVGGVDLVHQTANLNAIADGVLFTVPVQVANSAAPGSISIFLSAVLGASGTLPIGGVASPLSAGLPATVKILSRCDTNADGSVNIGDVQAAINAYLNKTACPIAGDTCGPVVIQSVIVSALGGACGA